MGDPRSGKCGRGAVGKVLVLLAVEDRGTSSLKRIRLQRITNGVDRLLVVQAGVEQGSVVPTDG